MEHSKDSVLLPRLGPVEQRTLAAIEGHWAAHRYGPSMRELAVASGLAGTGSVRAQLDRLMGAGLVLFDRIGPSGRVASRSLRLTEEGRRALYWQERVRRSTLVRGERELVLDARGLAAARRAELPLDALRATKEGARTRYLFFDAADRDFWAARVIAEMEGE